MGLLLVVSNGEFVVGIPILELVSVFTVIVSLTTCELGGGIFVVVPVLVVPVFEIVVLGLFRVD